jgi:hypothetical protein
MTSPCLAAIPQGLPPAWPGAHRRIPAPAAVGPARPGGASWDGAGPGPAFARMAPVPRPGPGLPARNPSMAVWPAGSPGKAGFPGVGPDGKTRLPEGSGARPAAIFPPDSRLALARDGQRFKVMMMWPPRAWGLAAWPTADMSAGLGCPGDRRMAGPRLAGPSRPGPAGSSPGPGNMSAGREQARRPSPLGQGPSRQPSDMPRATVTHQARPQAIILAHGRHS